MSKVAKQTFQIPIKNEADQEELILLKKGEVIPKEYLHLCGNMAIDKVEECIVEGLKQDELKLEIENLKTENTMLIEELDKSNDVIQEQSKTIEALVEEKHTLEAQVKTLVEEKPIEEAKPKKRAKKKA